MINGKVRLCVVDMKALLILRRSLTSLLTANVGRQCASRLNQCHHSLVTMSSSSSAADTATTASTRPTASPGQLDLSGIFPPIATAFDDNENVDYDKLAFNLRLWNDIPFKGTYYIGLLSLSAHCACDSLVIDCSQAEPSLHWL